jgi:flagellar basal-body rod modification protein FlgD
MTVNTNNTVGSQNNSSGSNSSSTPSTSMSQADFLKLMTAQLQAQDPTNPVDNTQFVSQMAQFSQLQSSQDMVTAVNTLNSTVNGALQTSQVLGSSNLVDRQVLVPSSTMQFDGGSMSGAVNATTAGNVTVKVTDGNGNVVRTMVVDAPTSGLTKFDWDGKDDDGNTLPSGNYKVTAANGDTAFDTYVTGKVTAVGYGGSDVGTYLQVAGIGGVPLSQVAQIL